MEIVFISDPLSNVDEKLVDGTLCIKQASRVDFEVLAKEMGSKILVYGRVLRGYPPPRRIVYRFTEQNTETHTGEQNSR